MLNTAAVGYQRPPHATRHTTHTPTALDFRSGSVKLVSTVTTAATATAAAERHTEDHGHMQQQAQEQQGHGVGVRESGPFGTAGEEGSLFAAAATPASDTTTATAATGHEHKDSTSPPDLATSPRSSAPGFVAPSSYLRPLAREREDHPRPGSQSVTAGEPGAKRIMHPLDREQREGLVSGP